MARHSNNRLKNKHRLYMGVSGSGKTTAIIRTLKNSRAARIIIWDPYEDYEGERCRSLSSFATEIKTQYKKARYRILVSVNPTKENFEFFSKCIWAIANGKETPIHVVAEEIADVTTVAKAPPNWGKIVRVGRKFALIFYAATQRPQECDKTTITQAGIKWAGRVEPHDSKKVAQIVAVTPDEIMVLQDLEYYERANNSTKKGKIIFKKPLKA